ncbi:hypothetical protein RFI_07298, partial [Reticulomyxa filosa]
TTIRIRLPGHDRAFLQGQFQSHETIADVRAFIDSNLQQPIPEYKLVIGPPIQVLDNEAITLQQLRLVPAAIINLRMKKSVLKNFKLSTEMSEQLNSRLNEELEKRLKEEAELKSKKEEKENEHQTQPQTQTETQTQIQTNESGQTRTEDDKTTDNQKQ